MSLCVRVLPYEVGAMTAEGGLFEEACCKLVVFHFDNPFVFERSLPLKHGHPGWRGERRGQRGGTGGGCRCRGGQCQWGEQGGRGDWGRHDAWRMR